MKASSPDPILASYFAAAARYKLLKADEEQALAEKIAANDAQIWVLLLSNQATAPALLDLLEKLICADEYQSRRTKDATAAVDILGMFVNLKISRGKPTWAATCEEFGKASRGPDHDRLWVKSATELASSLNDGTPEFAGYLRTVKAHQRAGSRLKDTFINANLRLVLRIAKTYKAPGELSLADLIQEGNLGMIRALEKFDPGLGYKFSTYASWWIRHHIGRAIANVGRQIRVPIHLHDDNRRLWAISCKFETQHGRQPTTKELSKICGYEPKKIRHIQKQSPALILSADTPVNKSDESEITFLDNLPGNEPDPSDSSDDAAKQLVFSLLSKLRSQEATVIKMRFGLDGHEEKTLEVIGGMFGVTRERIRQIEAKALQKLGYKAAILSAGDYM